MKQRKPPVIGKHTLETLTTGMYKNPLDAIREYIQNSCDAIDVGVQGRGRKGGATDIRINIDPVKRAIVIRDSGPGVAVKSADSVLRSCFTSLL